MNRDIYKVIKILDSETILLNVGRKDGINEGDRFQIYSVGKEIFDPNTNDSLGTLDTIKEIVTADNVLEQMCICRHHLKSSMVGLTTSLASLYTSPGNKKLNIDKEQMSDEMGKDYMIRIGDYAKKIYDINTKNSNN